MKVVILAGGFGTRISEESFFKPKPMIEVGEMPILWHIMKYYSSFGFHEFIICCGYKQQVIKQFFSDYFLYRSDITFDFTKKGSMLCHEHDVEPWKVTLIDTGLNTMTGGRIKRIAEYIGKEPFMLTYGDGISDVNIAALIDHHRRFHKIATLTAVQPKGRFGRLDIREDGCIRSFQEKQDEEGSWINGGFMVLEPEIFNYISGDDCTLEKEPLEKLASENQLSAYKHFGFWQCMDTLKDKNLLEELWKEGRAPWKTW